jgi:hypothetical protein
VNTTVPPGDAGIVGVVELSEKLKTTLKKVKAVAKKCVKKKRLKTMQSYFSKV